MKNVFDELQVVKTESGMMLSDLVLNNEPIVNVTTPNRLPQDLIDSLGTDNTRNLAKHMFVTSMDKIYDATAKLNNELEGIESLELQLKMLQDLRSHIDDTESFTFTNITSMIKNYENIISIQCNNDPYKMNIVENLSGLLVNLLTNELLKHGLER